MVDEPSWEWVGGVDGVPAGAGGFGAADLAGVFHGPLVSGIVRVGEETEGVRFAGCFKITAVLGAGLYR